MSTVEQRDKERIAGFLKVDAQISSSLSGRFRSKQLSPRSVLRCLMHVAGPESGILCGTAFWLVVGAVFKVINTDSMARMIASVVSAALGVDATAGAQFRTHAKRFLLGTTITTVCSGFRVWFSAKSEVLTVSRLKRILFSSLLEKDIATFDTEGTGELMSRLSSDCTIIGTVLSTNVNIVLQSGINLIGSLANLYRLSPRLAAMYLVISVFWVTATKKFGAYQQNLQRRVLNGDASMSGVAEQALSMIRLVRTSGCEWFEREKYYNIDGPRTGLSLRNKMGWALYVPIVTAFQNSLNMIVFIMGAKMVATGQMSGSDFAAFYWSSEAVQGSMGDVAGQIPSVMAALGAGEKVFELISLRPTIPIKGGHSVLTEATEAKLHSLRDGEPLLTVENVRFSYAHTQKIGDSMSETDDKDNTATAPGTPSRGVEVLTGFSLQISKGDMVALVGLSGSGKTSLVSLILRFYDAVSGRILLGGQEISKLDPAFLRSEVATVPQEPALFSVSMHDNIAYGLPGISRSEVEAAAKLSNAYDFICSMPDGFDTVVGSRGITLSGGQRQRVAIARALLRQPSLLILDEATSALDTVNEGAVLKAVDSIHKQGGLGILVIAHRLSTVKDATKIAVVSKGAIVEQGAHSQLIELKGYYKTLVEKQLASAEDMQ